MALVPSKITGTSNPFTSTDPPSTTAGAASPPTVSLTGTASPLTITLSSSNDTGTSSPSMSTVDPSSVAITG